MLLEICMKYVIVITEKLKQEKLNKSSTIFKRGLAFLINTIITGVVLPLKIFFDGYQIKQKV